eukprot:TRINITY_DN10259_c0_g1_i5.p1 TRINITY_DN10259_c0_g1~~TRINITY_DN10259_c0_g1_i5.p1  ORF type:complete len:379 (+),score=101.77 TRINITY_DN10259_c0_g1_i5:92-1228(+)
MIRRPPRSTLSSSSAASDVYKRQVSPEVTLLSDEDWGNTTGVFSIKGIEGFIGIVCSSKLYLMNLEDGKYEEVVPDGGYPNGSAKGACAAPPNGCYVAYSTSKFGGRGDLWKIDLLTKIKEPVSVDQGAMWGGCDHLNYHAGQVYGFGHSDGVIKVNPKSIDKKTTVTSNANDLMEGEVAMSDLYNANAICSDGFVMFAAVNNNFSDNVLYKVDTHNHTATALAVEPPTMQAMVPLYGSGRALLIPRTDNMRKYTGEDSRPSDSDLEDIFALYDKDGNGTLDRAEVASFWSDVFRQNDKLVGPYLDEAISAAVAETFEHFDTDKETSPGLIDRAEFLQHLKGTTFPNFPKVVGEPANDTDTVVTTTVASNVTQVQLNC